MQAYNMISFEKNILSGFYRKTCAVIFYIHNTGIDIHEYVLRHMKFIQPVIG